MKYIITYFFEKQFSKIVKDIDIKKLISRININSKKFIWLNYPFFKVKLNTKNKSYRIVILNNEEDVMILFINIFDKKDKDIWNNLNWNLHEKKILDWTDKNAKCIEEWKYYNIFK